MARAFSELKFAERVCVFGTRCHLHKPYEVKKKPSDGVYTFKTSSRRQERAGKPGSNWRIMVAKAAAPPSPLFHGHRFYLTRTIAANQRQQARNLIEVRLLSIEVFGCLADLISIILIRQAYDGLITDDPRGAIQLVDAEHLDPRQDWVSVEFVLDSVASGTLQDLSDYMGKEVAPRSPPPPQEPSNRARRIKYTVEDDARMLQFLQVCDRRRWRLLSMRLTLWRVQSSFPDRFKSMTSVPLSVWTEASRKRVGAVGVGISIVTKYADGVFIVIQVTQHSGQSMHERYRKQLVSKTPQERREILSRGKVRNGIRRLWSRVCF